MPIIVLYLVLLAAAFFFLIVRPQRRQMAARRALIASVEVGDEVITAGGIYGTVREMDDTKLVVEVAPGVNLTLAREAVSSRPSAEPPPGPALEAGPDARPEATHQERDDEPDAGERA
jgi:preprotein translocase subunit YajC